MSDGTVSSSVPHPGARAPAASSRAKDVLRTSLHLLQMIDQATTDEIIQMGLDEAVRLSESKIGFLHFVNLDQDTIRLHTWSTGTMKFCNAVEDSHYPIAKAGVWVDCIHQRRPVIHNDYASLKHRKGLPTGHVPVSRDLSVPVCEDGTIVAVLGVGNKADDYDEFDIELVSLLAESVWSIVRRKRSVLLLQEQVVARTAELKERNRELKRALTEIKTLSGIVPICSHCRQVRDDEGYWSRIEAYISAHSDARFSHGICPECLVKHYADIIAEEDLPD